MAKEAKKKRKRKLIYLFMDTKYEMKNEQKYANKLLVFYKVFLAA